VILELTPGDLERQSWYCNFRFNRRAFTKWGERYNNLKPVLQTDNCYYNYDVRVQLPATSVAKIYSKYY